MRKNTIWAAIAALALAAIACGVNINLPTEVKTGPTQTEEISVPAPDAAGPVGLWLSFGAGEISLAPGAADVLLSGSIRYNVADFKPEISTEGDDVYITQGDLNISGVPNFSDEVINKWDFLLNSAVPLNLNIKAGAYKGRYELGGLSLNRLEIADGASNVNLAFSSPNLIELKSFDYSTGASKVVLESLGNANLAVLTFRSGAGSYRLDFSGELQRDLEGLIESGISNLVIVVPAGTPASVQIEGNLTDVNAFGAWENDTFGYSQPGEGYQIQLRLKMGAGSLELRNK